MSDTPVPTRPNKDVAARKAAEQARVDFVVQRRNERGEAPRLTLKQNGKGVLAEFTHSTQSDASSIAMGDLRTGDGDFFQGITLQAAAIGSQGKAVDEQSANFLLSVVRAVQPRDELETLLALQMGAIHLATMTFAKRLTHVENIPQQDSAERALNKLSRTFATQLEALKRYRTGGQQKVIVEHVTVNEGGQAIVGNVSGRGLE